jgi:hypothetical protein
MTRLARPLSRAAPPRHPAPMSTAAKNAEPRELHRSQRALVAASLLACPERDGKTARTA